MTSSRRVTMRDVGRIAGVSHNTVSLVVRDSDRVLPETKARVRAVIEHLGYEPHVAAASLRSSRSQTIGYLVEPGQGADLLTEVDVFRNHVWRAITEAAEARHYFVLQSGFSDVRRARSLLSGGRIDGLLVDYLVSDAVVGDLMLGTSVPIVVIGRTSEIPGVSWVKANEEGGTYMAASHLIAQGHRRIELLTVSDSSHPIVHALRTGREARLGRRAGARYGAPLVR